MNILLCGAEGFLGRAIGQRLTMAGHHVVRGVRRLRQADDLLLDYRQDTVPEVWLPRLAGIDCVINAVGILREQRAGDFHLIHTQAPIALFQACAQASVRRVIQISALGGDNPPDYLRSKQAADTAMLQLLPQQSVVVRPGLVFGADGTSTSFFLALSSLPLQACPQGAGKVQPVHVEDVAALVQKLAEAPAVTGGILALPGPRALDYLTWLAIYRNAMGLAPAPRLPIPSTVMKMTACVAGLFAGSMLSKDTWQMLCDGNVANPVPASRLLGRPLRDPEAFITPAQSEFLRLRALAAWRRPLLLGVVAAIWLITALVSAGLFPLEASLSLLSPYGLSGSPAMWALGCAIALDMTMGVLTLLRPGRWLWWAQLAVMAVYSVLVIWRLPEFLIHPFGPILKNLALVAVLLMLLAEERKP